MVQGGLRPHSFCLPILKREEHRQAILEAATGTSSRFFLGTDSAPHPKHLKVCCAALDLEAFMDLLCSFVDGISLKSLALSAGKGVDQQLRANGCCYSAQINAFLVQLQSVLKLLYLQLPCMM